MSTETAETSEITGEASMAAKVAIKAATTAPLPSPPRATYNFKPTKAYLINPCPDRGDPVPTEGLQVYFDDDGAVGLRPVAYPAMYFCLGPTAAIQLADLILKHSSTSFHLAV